MKEADIFEKVKNIEREIRELCDKRYRDGVSDGFDDGYNQGYFDAKGTNDDGIREQGRKDAWECAKKIYSLSAGEIINIFGGCSTWVNYSASEAIAKVKEYEDRQKWEEEWNRKQAEQLCNKVEENEEKRSCSNCGQPREGALNQCIPFTKGACYYGHTAWIPKRAKYKYAFEDGHKFCTDNLPNEEQLIKLVREHGKVSISLREEQMKGDK